MSNMNQYPDTLMVSENRSDVEKMKEALQKKENTCRTINKVGTVLTTIGSPALVTSLVSPFDFKNLSISFQPSHCSVDASRRT